MRRAIIAMLVGLSSAVCVLAVVLLVRSFTWGEYFGVSFIDEQPDRYLLRHVFLQSNSGYVTLVFRRQSAKNRRAADELRETIHRYNKGRPPDRVWWEKWPAAPGPQRFTLSSLGFDRSESSRSMNPLGGEPIDYMYNFSMPHAYLIAASAVIPIVVVWRWSRLRKRRRRGLCRGCDYDLRASTGRCPECGREIEPDDQTSTPARAA